MRPRTRLGCELLEDRLAPATNLQLNAVRNVDANNSLQTAPVYGQMTYLRAEFTSTDMPANNPFVVRYTVNGIAADSGTVNLPAGGGAWYWYRGGWYAGTSGVSVTVMVDPNNVVAEANETDNTLTFTLTPVAPTDLPSKFLQPIGKTFRSDWWINNYADVDPRSGFQSDYRGGDYRYDGHDAIDAGPMGFDAQDAGIPLYAAANGTVAQVQDGYFDRETTMGSRPGNFVLIDHGNNWQTLYYHFAANTIAVKAGDVVKAGQVIGLMGSAGSSTGTHVHYTAIYRGCQVEAGVAPTSYWLDPLLYMGDYPTFGSRTGISGYTASSDGGERREPIGSFSTADANRTAFFWLELGNAKTTDLMQFRWYRPNGTVWNTFGFSPNGNYHFSWWAWSLPANNFYSATGTWQIAYLLNGVEFSRKDFAVNATGEAGIRVHLAGAQIIDGRTTPIDYGSVAQNGAAPSRTFTVQNHGFQTLTLSGLQLPPNFVLTSTFPSSIPVFGSATFTVQMNTQVVGTQFGRVRFLTNDPDTPEYDFNLTGVVTGSPTFGSPILTLNASALGYNYLSRPRAFAPAATLTDANSTALLRVLVEVASGGDGSDALGVRNQGTGAGQIGVAGTTVTYGGTPIATFTGGTGGVNLVLNLNGSATPAAVQALIRNLTYAHDGPVNFSNRRYLRVSVLDESSNSSNLAVAHVTPSMVARAPTVAVLPNRTITRGAVLTQAGSFADAFGNSWTATVDYGDGSGVQPLTLNPDKTFNLSRLYAAAPGNYTVTVTVDSDTGGFNVKTFTVTVVPPRTVAKFVVQVDPTDRTKWLATLVFSGVVTLPGTPASAFAIAGPLGNLPFTVDTSASTGTQTIVKLRFTPTAGPVPAVPYRLRAVSNLITDATGSTLDGDADGLSGTDYSQRFFGPGRP